MTFKIEITDSSISIKTQEQLFDAQGNPVAVGSAHRKAVSVGDFAADPANPTQEERDAFRAKVEQVASDTIGQSLSSLIADKTADGLERDALKAEVERQKQRVRTLMDQASKLANEKAALEEQLGNVGTRVSSGPIR